MRIEDKALFAAALTSSLLLSYVAILMALAWEGC